MIATENTQGTQGNTISRRKFLEGAAGVVASTALAALGVGALTTIAAPTEEDLERSKGIEKSPVINKEKWLFPVIPDRSAAAMAAGVDTQRERQITELKTQVPAMEKIIDAGVRSGEINSFVQEVVFTASEGKVGALVFASKTENGNAEVFRVNSEEGIAPWLSEAENCSQCGQLIAENGEGQRDRYLVKEGNKPLYQVTRNEQDATGLTVTLKSLQNGKVEENVILAPEFTYSASGYGNIRIFRGMKPLKAPEGKAENFWQAEFDFYSGMIKINKADTGELIAKYDPKLGQLIEGKMEDLFVDLPQTAVVVEEKL